MVSVKVGDKVFEVPVWFTKCWGTDKIVINFPGYRGSAAGYGDKYLNIAEMLRTKRLASMAGTYNFPIDGLDYADSSTAVLRAVITQCLEDSFEEIGVENPEIYLIGTSAGGGVVAKIANEFEAIKKILLIEPAPTIGKQQVIEGIQKFSGEVSVLVGDHSSDFVEFGRLLVNNARKSPIKRFAKVPNCDHHLSGEQNGKILSKSPLWAFFGDRLY